jgi:hypothetical protein
MYARSSFRNGIDIPGGLSYIPPARKGDPAQINRIQREVLFMLSKEAAKLKEMIVKAIQDHELTTTEYEKILALANADINIDPQERQLLLQLHELVSSGGVKRVPG